VLLCFLRIIEPYPRKKGYIIGIGCVEKPEDRLGIIQGDDCQIEYQ
jgi:hypothetical protein